MLQRLVIVAACATCGAIGMSAAPILGSAGGWGAIMAAVGAAFYACAIGAALVGAAQLDRL